MKTVKANMLQKSSVKVMLSFGVISPMLFIITFLIQDFTKPSFNPIRHFVSHLSLGENGWVNVLNLVALGLSTLVFSIGVRSYFNNGTSGFWGPMVSSLVGIGFLLDGLFAIDPGLDFPPGVTPTKTVHGTIHEFAGLLTFVSLTALCFVFAKRFKADAKWREWEKVSRLAGFLIPITWIVTSVLVSLDYAGIYPNAPGGLFERISLVIACLWLSMTAYKMIKSINSN
ncbi:MAG: DUF998 domain-containing protein [Anaerolineales bacterium]|nr:DUF998 domain-containing protein [Anaerolineales bacterium]